MYHLQSDFLAVVHMHTPLSFTQIATSILPDIIQAFCLLMVGSFVFMQFYLIRALLLQKNISKNMLMAIGAIFFLSLCIAPASVFAQTNGSGGPMLGVTVPGQTAATPQMTLMNAINWVGNVAAPIAAGATTVATVVQWKTGRGWVPMAATTAGLVSISGILRMVEYFVQQ